MLNLQVRSIDGAVFWVETESTATIGSIKQSIMSARGIDVIMQKLICTGKLLADESTPELCGITERDFLVLVTAKLSLDRCPASLFLPVSPERRRLAWRGG